MAKVTLSPGIASISGRISDDYMFRTVNGQTYLCSMPKRRKEPNLIVGPPENALCPQERFRLAHQHASEIMQDDFLQKLFTQIWLEDPNGGTYRTLRGYIFGLCNKTIMCL